MKQMRKIWSLIENNFKYENNKGKLPNRVGRDSQTEEEWEKYTDLIIAFRTYSAVHAKLESGEQFKVTIDDSHWASSTYAHFSNVYLYRNNDDMTTK